MQCECIRLCHHFKKGHSKCIMNPPFPLAFLPPIPQTPFHPPQKYNQCIRRDKGVGERSGSFSRSIGPGSKGLSVSIKSLSELSCSRACSCVVRVAAIRDRSFGGRGVDGIAIADRVLRRVALSVEFTASSGLAPLVELVHTWQRVVRICHQDAKCIPDTEFPSAVASYNWLLSVHTFILSKSLKFLGCSPVSMNTGVILGV